MTEQQKNGRRWCYWDNAERLKVERFADVLYVLYVFYWY